MNNIVFLRLDLKKTQDRPTDPSHFQAKGANKPQTFFFFRPYNIINLEDQRGS